MKMLPKPMSSPSRTEKFPPPLMRFLRSNVGSRSRSRGRSRSSPMFIRKKNAAIETQEPTSPKVTCIGQVRIRRPSKQSGGGNGRTKASSRGPCSCWRVRKSLFCRHFAKKLRPRSLRPVWHKCDFLFPFGYCRRPESRDDSLKTESNLKGNYKASDTGDEDDDEEEEEDETQSKNASSEANFNSYSPPKNALLLTRCRSAPYRSSSLASRFWGSPLTTSETEENSGENKVKQQEHVKERGLERPTSESELSCRDSISVSEWEIDKVSEGKLGVVREFEGGIINGRRKELETGEGGDTGRPRLLTRSKSEPGRSGERLSSFWRDTRLGSAEPSRSPHVCEKSID